MRTSTTLEWLRQRMGIALSAEKRANVLLHKACAKINAKEMALHAAVASNGCRTQKALVELEQRVNAAFTKTLNSTEKLFAPELNQSRSELTRLAAGTSPKSICALERNLAVEKARLEAQSRAILVNARRQERRSHRELMAFRCRHHLDREACYPESRALHYAVLFFLGLIESVANAGALSVQSGLLFGLASAALLAATNLSFGYCAGRAASGFFHRALSVKCLAAILVGAWLVFELFFALTMAHYRSALAFDINTAATQALVQMKTAPLAIDDLISLLLALFTVAFGVGSLLTGLRTDDKHPVYGTVTRMYKRANDRLMALRSGYISAIDAIYANGAVKLDMPANEETNTTAACQFSVDRLRNRTAALGHAMDSLSAAYRSAVLEARKAFTQVLGQEFTCNDPQPLPPSTTLDSARSATAKAEKMLAEYPARLEYLKKERDATRERIKSQHAKALAETAAFFSTTDQAATKQSAFDQEQFESTPESDDTGALRDEVESTPTARPINAVLPPLRKKNGTDEAVYAQ